MFGPISYEINMLADSMYMVPFRCCLLHGHVHIGFLQMLPM